VSWQWNTVRTGIWKRPVPGPRMARRLNIDGDGQGDLDGHGGEMRAVLVYQIQSYDYWQRCLKRDDFTFGQFGENLTVDGLLYLPDHDAAKLRTALNIPALSPGWQGSFRELLAAEQGSTAIAEKEPVLEPHVTAGRLTAERLAALGIPLTATAYICGPDALMKEVSEALTGLGIPVRRVRTELFGAMSAFNPGVTARDRPAPHQPSGKAGTGPLVTFARSGLSVRYDTDKPSLLDLADACDVPTRWACRSGVCHTCVTPLLSGDVGYSPSPLEPPPAGQVLPCCARPRTDLVLDM
jgi:ferredoxin